MSKTFVALALSATLTAAQLLPVIDIDVDPVSETNEDFGQIIEPSLTPTPQPIKAFCQM